MINDERNNPENPENKDEHSAYMPTNDETSKTPEKEKTSEVVNPKEDTTDPLEVLSVV